MKQLDVDVDKIRGEISRRSLKEFIKTFWDVVEPGSPFVDGFHIDAICDHLAALAKREIKNLLINIPPRHAKSTICSVLFPAWQWANKPSEQFLYTSYSFPLAERDSTRCRRLVGSELYQKCFGDKFGIQEDQNTKRRFDNDKAGYRLISSVLASGTTGEGGSIIVVDDPHSVNETESDLRRENVSRWFAEVFFNRLNDPATGCRLVVGQRIHNGDLSGFILENYKKNWTHLNLPYEYDPARSKKTTIGWTDPRAIEGQPLWPERWPEEEINQQKTKPKAFAAQFNQNPLDTDNALFKIDNFVYYDDLPEGFLAPHKRVHKNDTFTIMTADLAISQAKTADYTAIITAAIAKTGEVIVLDVVRARLNGTKIVPTLVELNAIYKPDYIMVEDVAFQRVILDQARAAGLPVRQLKAKGDKETRSIPLQVKFEQKQVWFPKDRTWLSPLVKELVEFPQSTWDDQVDALAYMAAEAANRTRTRPDTTGPAVQPKSPGQMYNDALLQGLRF